MKTYTMTLELTKIRDPRIAERLAAAFTDFAVNELPDELANADWRINTKVRSERA